MLNISVNDSPVVPSTKYRPSRLCLSSAWAGPVAQILQGDTVNCEQRETQILIKHAFGGSVSGVELGYHVSC